MIFNPLSANPTKWSNTLKQFVGNFPTNCLSVFDHFMNLACKGLKHGSPSPQISMITNQIKTHQIYSSPIPAGRLQIFCRFPENKKDVSFTSTCAVSFFLLQNIIVIELEGRSNLGGVWTQVLVKASTT